MDVNMSEEFLKAIPDLLIAALGLLAAWFIGSRVSAGWHMYRRRRELDLDAVQRFFQIYGEFFAVWKLWHAPPHRGQLSTPDTSTIDRPACWLELLERAAATEGALEALLVKLAVERDLTSDQCADLARFRQGLQCLRESIEHGKVLRTYKSDRADEWKATTDESGRGHAYVGFKHLATHVSDIVLNAPERRSGGDYRLTPEAAIEASTDVGCRRDWWEPRESRLHR